MRQALHNNTQLLLTVSGFETTVIESNTHIIMYTGSSQEVWEFSLSIAKIIGPRMITRTMFTRYIWDFTSSISAMHWGFIMDTKWGLLSTDLSFHPLLVCWWINHETVRDWDWSATWGTCTYRYIYRHMYIHRYMYWHVQKIHLCVACVQGFGPADLLATSNESYRLNQNILKQETNIDLILQVQNSLD